MIAGNEIWLTERTSRNFKSCLNTERDTTSTSNDSPGLQEKTGIAKKLGLTNTMVMDLGFSE